MATNRTFTMIKPDATGAGNTGKIIDRIIGAGFTIKAMKWTQLSMNDAAAFYAVHKDRPFFGELTEYMTSAPIVAAILEKDNAVADFRTLIGATNPEEAAPGTIRADFAQSIAANAVHGPKTFRHAHSLDSHILCSVGPGSHRCNGSNHRRCDDDDDENAMTIEGACFSSATSHSMPWSPLWPSPANNSSPSLPQGLWTILSL